MSDIQGTHADTPDVARRARWDWADRLVVGAYGALAAYALLQILLMRFGRDQGIYAVVANTVLEGGMPYRDAWDFKPPGIFLVYTLARGVFGANEWGIRVVEVLAFGSLVPAMAVLSKRFFGDLRPGLMGAAVAILVEAQLEFWHTAQPESFGGVLAILGLVLSTWDLPLEGASARWKPWVIWLGAGMLFGAAGLMKPHLLGVAVVAAGHAAWRLRGRGAGVSRQVQAFVSIGAGSVASLVLVLLWFAARGAYSDLHYTLFVFAPGYAATTWQKGYLIYFTYSALHGWLMGFSAVMAFGVVLSITLRAQAPREREGLWLIFLAALPQVLGIAVQSKFFPYHYGSVLPFGALMAGPGLWKIWSRARAWSWMGPTAYFLAAAIALDARSATRDLSETFGQRSWERTKALFAGSAEREALAGKQYSVADVSYAANMRVAAWLRANTTPADRVFVWGFEPQIYDAAGRHPASRFIYNVAQRVEWEHDWARDGLMAELLRAPPKVIVVERGDVFPVVTGNHDDSASSLLGFAQLHDLLETRYAFRESIQDFDLYVLQTGTLPAEQ